MLMEKMKSDYSLPHKFPRMDKSDSWESIIAWECQACGEWIREYGKQEKTECTIDWRRLYMNGRQKVMKEPPMGSVVIDVNGSAWQRHPVGWAIAGSDMSWAYTWKKVVEQELYSPDRDFNPSEDWKPVLGDPRLPLIVYIPHEELIYDKEDEDE